MFGYVAANLEKLTLEQKNLYRSCYCGLCRTLGKRHGTISRITLTYDMTFLVLFLSSLYKSNTEIQTERCLIHPIKPHEYWKNEITNYAADMNVALAYYNFLDDWTDDKKLLALCEVKLFGNKYKQIAASYPRQCYIIYKQLAELSEIERSGELNPDIPANCFGKLMSEIFVFKEDEYTKDLRAFGAALGKFIYIMDACLDLKSDIKSERYNPMIASSPESFSDILNILMADCIEKYKRLPITENKELIENILFSGVWTKYQAAKTKEAHK